MTRLTGGSKSLCLFLAAVMITACGSEPAPPQEQASACGLATQKTGAFVAIPAGDFVKGTNALYPEERPEIRLNVPGFQIQAHEVTNGQFAAFVSATGYITDAERSVTDRDIGAGSAVFSSLIDGEDVGAVWSLVPGATWRSPHGPESDIKGMDTAPVVHVSHADARAYAAWVGGRLPSEVEWEYAAHTGLPEQAQPFSGAFGPNGPRANTWQGIFPIGDTGEDGFTNVAPVGCFDADKNGLYDMIGNVWEWTDTPYAPGHHTIKGGSYLCAENYCRRYRPSSRQPQESDFSSSHIGFRVVRDDPPP